MRNEKIINFYLVVLFVFIILLRLVFMNIFSDYYEIIVSCFFIVFSYSLYKLIGFKKDNDLSKYNAIQITIIGLLLYILLTNLAGLYFGFLRNAYSLSLISIIKNTYMIIIMVVSSELVRWMVAGNSKVHKYPLVILTILYIALDVVLGLSLKHVISSFNIFRFITTYALGSIARNYVCSSLNYKVSYVPSLVLRLFFSLYVIVVPIIPDFGDYLNSVINFLTPFLIYFSIMRLVNHTNKERVSEIKGKIWYFYLPFWLCCSFIVILVSGVFKYKIIAIGTGSMEPRISAGDALIYEKYDGSEKPIKNQVIVFNHNGKYITHRVNEIVNDGDNTFYITKGDANLSADDFKVYENDIVGIGKLNIKYIGYPTIWFQELIN
ncbi:MAG: signal peptidase I [Bacilli bacterium]|nr:signal peptidase I [Bacilli bacterium]